MTDTSTLEKLIEIASEQRDAAATELGRRQQSHHGVRKQLEALETYREEYVQRFDAERAQGMNIATINNYRRFIHALGQAIEHQKRLLDQSQRKVDDGRHEWQARQQRLGSFDVLATRRREAAAQAEARREQRQTDEFAMRAHAHSNAN